MSMVTTLAASAAKLAANAASPHSTASLARQSTAAGTSAHRSPSPEAPKTVIAWGDEASHPAQASSSMRPSSASSSSNGRPNNLLKTKGWTSSRSFALPPKRFEVVEDCTLERSELQPGADGGGGLRVRPLQLKDLTDEHAAS